MKELEVLDNIITTARTYTPYNLLIIINCNRESYYTNYVIERLEKVGYKTVNYTDIDLNNLNPTNNILVIFNTSSLDRSKLSKAFKLLRKNICNSEYIEKLDLPYSFIASGKFKVIIHPDIEIS